MSKIGLFLVALAAAFMAAVLLLLGWRAVYVAPERARTVRGRYLLAVAFFLALFAGYVDRVRGADAPVAGEAQQALSLAEMQKAVETILRGGPAGNDWNDPDINPNLSKVFTDAGLIKHRDMVTCYDRAAVPAKARGEELAALQKTLLDEKVAEGVISEEVAGKITAIPEPRPGTAAEVRAFQLKVRRIARQLYAAAEIDSATLKGLEKAIAMPIADLDPLKALRGDVTYVLQTCAPSWHWPAETRKELTEMLVKLDIINAVRTRRGEMDRHAKVAPEELEKTRERISKAAKLIADAKYDPALKQDETAKGGVVVVGKTPLDQYRLKARRAARILLAEGFLTEYDAQAVAKVLDVPLFGPMDDVEVHRGLDNF